MSSTQLLVIRPWAKRACPPEGLGKTDRSSNHTENKLLWMMRQHTAHKAPQSLLTRDSSRQHQGSSSSWVSEERADIWMVAESRGNCVKGQDLEGIKKEDSCKAQDFPPTILTRLWHGYLKKKKKVIQMKFQGGSYIYPPPQPTKMPSLCPSHIETGVINDLREELLLNRLREGGFREGWRAFLAEEQSVWLLPGRR